MKLNLTKKLKFSIHKILASRKLAAIRYYYGHAFLILCSFTAHKTLRNHDKPE